VSDEQKTEFSDPLLAIDQPPDDSKKPVLDEIATLGRMDITFGYVGPMLLNPDTVLKTEGGGGSFALQIYEDLERDDHVFAELQKRKNTVSSREWQIMPATKEAADKEIADFVENELKSLPFGHVIKAMLDAKLKGFSVAEVMWQVRPDGRIGIKEIIARDQRRFAFDLKRELRFLTLEDMIRGQAVPLRKFLVLSSGSKVSNPYGSGLGMRLYWPVWFKKNGVRFWAIFLEKFGSPTVVGKYPPGTPIDQQDALLQAIEAIQQEAAVKIPDNMIVEILEAQRTGSIDSYKQWQDHWNKAISLVIVGQTLTTDVGSSGSRALGQVHNEVRLDLVKDDADEISECLNSQLIKWLVDYNFPGVTLYPKFWIRTDPEKDLVALATRDNTLAHLGLPIGQKYFYDTYAIPQPDPGEPIIVPPAGAGAAGNAGGNGNGMDPEFSGRRAPKVFLFSEGMKPNQASIDQLIAYAVSRRVGVDEFLSEVAASIKGAATRDQAVNHLLALKNRLPAPSSVDGGTNLIATGKMIGRAGVASEMQASGAKFAVEVETDFAPLPPAEAVAFFSDLVPLPPDAVHQLADEARQWAFTLGKVSQLEVITRVKGALDQALSQGMSLSQFQNEIETIYSGLGLSRENPYYWETVYRTNLQTAYQAGRYQQMTQPFVQRYRPFWQYDAVNDDRTRPTHLAQDKKVYRFDAAFWQIWYPPCGFNCRCTVHTLAEEEVAAQKLTVLTDLPTERPDPGFGGVPAAGIPSALRQRLVDLNQSLT